MSCHQVKGFWQYMWCACDQLGENELTSMLKSSSVYNYNPAQQSSGHELPSLLNRLNSMGMWRLHISCKWSDGEQWSNLLQHQKGLTSSLSGELSGEPKPPPPATPLVPIIIDNTVLTVLYYLCYHVHVNGQTLYNSTVYGYYRYI